MPHLLKSSPDDPPVTTHDIATRSILKLVLAVAAVWLLVKLWYVVILVVIALVIVGTLRPLVAWLEAHRFHRVAALGLVSFVALVAVVLLGVLTLPALIAQIGDIAERAPALQASVTENLQRSNVFRPLAATIKSLDLKAAFDGMAKNALEWSSQVVILIGEAVTIFVLALYVLASREREQGALFALVPRQYHLRLARVLASLEEIVGGYVRGQVITSVLIAIFTFVLLTIFGVNNAVALAVFAGVTDVVPFIGGLVATTPVVLATFPKGVGPTIIVLVAMFLYQEVESRILVPRIYGRVLRLSPATVIVSLLIGGTLMGLVGALLALPVAAGLRTIIKDMRVELPGEADLSVGQLRREAAEERIYAARAEGASAVEAAAIAGTMMAEGREASDASSSSSSSSSATSSAAVTVPAP